MAFVVFMIVKFMNKLRRKEEPAPATTKICHIANQKYILVPKEKVIIIIKTFL